MKNLPQLSHSGMGYMRFIAFLCVYNITFFYGAVFLFCKIFGSSFSVRTHLLLFSVFSALTLLMAFLTHIFLKKLSRNIAYTQDILEYSIDGLARIDANGLVQYVNTSFCELFGFTKDSALGVHWQSLFAQQSIGTVCHEQQTMIQTGKAVFEAMGSTKDKVLFPVFITLIKGQSSSNEASGFYFYAKDMTEQKTAQKEATQKHKELRQLFDNLPVVIFYKDDADNIIRTNKLASQLLGKKVADLEGKSANDIFPEKYKEYFQRDLEVLRAQTPKRGIVEEFYHADGYKSWVKTDKFPFKDPVNNDDRILSISQDITNMKIAEMKQEQLIDYLKDANNKLERFAYICSHDLQEPMRIAASYGEKLMNKCGDAFLEDSPEKKYITFITQNCSRSHQMIGHLLEYTHIQDITDNIEEVDLNNILKMVKDFMKYKFHKRRLKIIAPHMPKIRANREQILQLFRSIIDNAIKFQPDDAKVVITIDEDDTYYHYDITDNGIGITSDKLDEIFDIFRRLNKRDEYDGEGVGLTMAKRIVENHNGKISAFSDGKQGTKISFSLPKDIHQFKSNERFHGYKQLC